MSDNKEILQKLLKIADNQQKIIVKLAQTNPETLSGPGQSKEELERLAILMVQSIGHLFNSIEKAVLLIDKEFNRRGRAGRPTGDQLESLFKPIFAITDAHPLPYNGIVILFRPYEGRAILTALKPFDEFLKRLLTLPVQDKEEVDNNITYAQIHLRESRELAQKIASGK